MIGRKNYNDIKEVGINDYFRNKIDKNHYTKIIEKRDIDGRFYITVKGSLISTKEEGKLISSLYASVLFLDSYKMLSDKIKNLTANEYELNIFSVLSNMSSLEEIKDYYKGNDNAIITSLKHSEDFFNLSTLAKIKIMKSLTKDQNDYLERVAPIHRNDMEKYNTTIDKEFIYNYYDKQTRYLYKRSEINPINSVAMMISSFLKNIFDKSKEDVYGTLDSIYSDVLDNLSELGELDKDSSEFYDECSKEYQEDSTNFINKSLVDLGIMESFLINYFVMRKNDMIKPKTLKKE